MAILLSKPETMDPNNLSGHPEVNHPQEITYYPVFLDVAELKAAAEIEEKEVYHAEELLEMAIQYDCSELQTVVLLLKNAFEGHLFLTFGISARNMLEQGTLRIDPAKENPLELSLHFIDHLDEYSAGLKQIWQQLQDISPHLKNVYFDSLVLFLLSSKLYKLPVSSLESINIKRFQNLTERRKRFYRCYFEISIHMQQAVAELRVIEHVNELYQDRYNPYISKLSARENLLFQLGTKLFYANDPTITTEEELEKKYFAFLIEKEIKKDSGRLQVNYSAWDDEQDDLENPSGLKVTIKHLFRAISKNCRELFTLSDEAAQPVHLKKVFMDSNSIYNEMNFDFSDQLIQYHRLINLYIQVFNIRKIHDLPVTFIDYTAIERDKLLIKLNEETIQKLKINIGNKLLGLKEHNHTAFKSKHVSDEELSKFHEEYLKMRIQFLDQRIADILTKINNIMQEKTLIASTL